tara:strand:+ start:88 stop:426 length:339 start_codon:yes stop_codon:yes gene_type:complete
MSVTEELIRACFEAWQNHDLQLIQGILAPDFTFRSPYDNDLSREEYFEKCWPHNDKIHSFKIRNLISKESEGFVRYTCKLANGHEFENAEFFTTEGNQITRIIVFFGELPAS